MISNYLVLDTGMHGEAIATATDTISSISTENANYKILVEDLAEKLILQERRIGELKRKCNISICFFWDQYTYKSTSAENYYDAQRVDSKISTSPGQVLQLEQSRCAVDSGKEIFLNI